VTDWDGQFGKPDVFLWTREEYLSFEKAFSWNPDKEYAFYLQAQDANIDWDEPFDQNLERIFTGFAVIWDNYKPEYSRVIWPPIGE